MAGSGDLTSSPFATFRWLSRRTRAVEKSFSADNVLPARSAGPALPGFRNNFASGSTRRCVVVRNELQRSFSTDAPSPPSLESGTSGSSSSSSVDSEPAPPSMPGPKVKLVHEGDASVCRIAHSRTVLSKILSSKFLRRWESHHLYLSKTHISSKTATGYMELSVPYSCIEEMSVLPRLEASQKYCLYLVIPDGSLLLQVNNAYVRDQWFHSIAWKKNMMKYKKLLSNTRRPDIFIKELKNLVDMSLTTSLQDDGIYNTPLEIISELMQENVSSFPRSCHEELITVISPLLEMTTPTPEICDFLTNYCHDNPRSRLVLEMFTPIVQRILKHNMDFGKYPKTRLFVQEYIQALSYQNDERKAVQKFITSIHGISSTCPHPRVLPNLVSICLAATNALYEEKRSRTAEDPNDLVLNSDWQSRLLCFLSILEIISSHEDWRPGLAQLLQPIPFPDDALSDHTFSKSLKPVLSNLVCDERCDVHLMVLGVREEKEGWIHLYCPGGVACEDDGDLWSEMLRNLLDCCCRRKKFLEGLSRALGPCLLRALRDDPVLQDALCALLELQCLQGKDLQAQAVATLQSTPAGKHKYAQLCTRIMHIKEVQSKGGPRKLTLPTRSTDADVAKLLSCGSFGNLECLSLAFTQVTSACAEQLIKLPSLRYLNLWSTQFGDAGLRLICEHLPRLQVLNLCETPVTDKGLLCLTNLKSLRKLNLNSTSLSAQTFEKLKQKLPALLECDIRYTDAW